MDTKQRFSLRKYKIGAVSVLLGTLLFMGGVTTTSVDAVTNDSSVASLVQSASAQEAPSSPIAAIVKEEASVATVQAMPSSTDTDAQGGVTSTTSNMAETPSSSEPLAEEVNRLTVGEKEATPQNIDSNEIISIPHVWDSGYKGQGTVVAVIDSGLDSQHDVLQLSDVSQAKYHSQEELEAAKQKAGITYTNGITIRLFLGITTWMSIQT